ncbi:MAG: phenylalanine--tRNA ligase subunit alpha [Candidatus Ancillula sp.]|nr:phenylalanine--tRNA ligase subunit alpha [Candidatus Ancillula sp.]
MNDTQLDDALENVLLVLRASKTSLDAQKVRKDFFAGPIAEASKNIGKLDPSARGKAGASLSKVKAAFDSEYEPLLERLSLEDARQEQLAESVDVSAYAHYLGGRYEAGARHPLQVLQADVAKFFQSIGWRIAEGPEVEASWFNFDALNFGVDHPARQMQDTFYAKTPEMVLRTHTSPVQARSLIQEGAPLYIACPGRVYRTDELDATHTPVFHQCEGLAVDEGLTMEHLLGTIDAFAKAMFGNDAKTRLRPSYFPFTEPSAEMDVWYPRKKGGAGWIEWGGCGMVHPNVLRSCGVDPDKYTGFAFGMGIERTLMLRHDIQDMHDIVEGDVRFSRQFGMES